MPNVKGTVNSSGLNPVYNRVDISELKLRPRGVFEGGVEG